MYNIGVPFDLRTEMGFDAEMNQVRVILVTYITLVCPIFYSVLVIYMYITVCPSVFWWPTFIRHEPRTSCSVVTAVDQWHRITLSQAPVMSSIYACCAPHWTRCVLSTSYLIAVVSLANYCGWASDIQVLIARLSSVLQELCKCHRRQAFDTWPKNSCFQDLTHHMYIGALFVLADEYSSILLPFV